MKLLFFSSLLVVISIADIYGKQNQKSLIFTLINNKIVYSASVTDNAAVPKDQFFERAQNWYTKTYQTADNRLTVNNLDEGLLSGTGIIHAKGRDEKAEDGDVFFTIDIHTDNGKYEYKVHDIYTFDKTGKFYYSDMYNEEQFPPNKPKWPNTYRASMLSHMNNKITMMLADFQKEMANPILKK